jgi:hypothetical protein
MLDAPWPVRIIPTSQQKEVASNLLRKSATHPVTENRNAKRNFLEVPLPFKICYALSSAG